MAKSQSNPPKPENRSEFPSRVNLKFCNCWPFLAEQSGGNLASQPLPLSAHSRLPYPLLRVFRYA